MEIDLQDKTLFGNDAGEDEDENVLVSYFVNQPSFKDFLDSNVRLQVAKGRKGMGKSALLAKFAHDLRQASNRPLIVNVVPSSLVALREPPSTESAVILENYWKQVICGAVNMELAQEIGFAWKDDDVALIETAELVGFKNQNLVGSLLQRVAGKISIGGIEIAHTKKPAPNHEKLLQRVRSEAGKSRFVWLLLDDIDTKFQNTTAQQAFISSFFSACRYLIKNINGLGIRATVRTDVWSSLRAAEDLDKFDQYVTEIGWTANQQKEILANRILGYVRRKAPTNRIAKNWTASREGDSLIAMVFLARMRWGESQVASDRVIRVLGSGRPRWMAQLCRFASLEAKRSGRDRVGIQEINAVMGEFGRRRLSDLYKEHGHQFNDLKRLIESFSQGPRRYTTNELTTRITNEYIKIVGGPSVPNVDGAPYRDSWQLAHFIYKCGFITGHNIGEKSLDVPEFVSYESRPDLLESSTNLDDGMLWEIQPAYRKILRTS